MRRYLPSSQAHTVKKKLEGMLHEESKSKSYSQSPQFSRTNFSRRNRLSPYHLSGPEIPQLNPNNPSNQRKSSNLSALLQHQKPEKSGSRLTKRETEKDMTVFRRSDAQVSSKKRTRRFQYMRQRQASRQNYQLGVLHTPQQIMLQPKVKASESTQPAVLFHQKEPQNYDTVIEQLHYHMVRMQQNSRKQIQN